MKSLEIKPLYRKHNIVTQESGNEILIYDLNANKLFCLNETSSIVWELCDGENSILQISNKLSDQLKSPISEDFVWLAINQLQNEKLLDNKIEIPKQFNGNSRREMIKKIGLATCIALPIISSLTAPKAIQAASVCLPNFGSCSSSTQCCSTNTTTLRVQTAGGGGGVQYINYSGACCRSNSGDFGAINTCVPASSGGQIIQAGNITYNGNNTLGDTVTCHP